MKKEIFICSLVAFVMLASATGISSYVEDVNATLGDSGYFVLERSSPKPLDLGDLQFIWGVENATADYQSIGCGSNGTHFFVTGGNNGTEPNKVYIFDFDGNYIDSFDQDGTADWGWLDLAWDGEYFYGSQPNSYTIDVFADDGTVVDHITAPVPWCAGMAYDPVTDHLWTIDKWTDMVLYELDMTGAIINSYQQDKNVYGLAWDDVTEGGPYLWCAVQDPQCTFYQFSPSIGNYTGLSFEAHNPGTVDNKACGLGFTTAWNGEPTLFAIQQCDQTPAGVGDQLAGYSIESADNTPPSVTIINPEEGYFHFSGKPLIPTPLNLLADTVSIGGFRLQPITILAADDVDENEDLLVKIYINDEERGNATYCHDCDKFEWKWTGWALGTYNLTITAEDTSTNVGSAEMEVWNFCFIP